MAGLVDLFSRGLEIGMRQRSQQMEEEFRDLQMRNMQEEMARRNLSLSPEFADAVARISDPDILLKDSKKDVATLFHAGPAFLRDAFGIRRERTNIRISLKREQDRARMDAEAQQLRLDLINARDTAGGTKRTLAPGQLEEETQSYAINAIQSARPDLLKSGKEGLEFKDAEMNQKFSHFMNIVKRQHGSFPSEVDYEAIDEALFRSGIITEKERSLFEKFKALFSGGGGQPGESGEVQAGEQPPPPSEDDMDDAGGLTPVSTGEKPNLRKVMQEEAEKLPDDVDEDTAVTTIVAELTKKGLITNDKEYQEALRRARGVVSGRKARKKVAGAVETLIEKVGSGIQIQPKTAKKTKEKKK